MSEVQASNATPKTPSLETPSLGLTTLTTLVVANMIGAGVFTSSGFSLAALGHPGRVMLAWWLCGAWAICGAICYGGLVARLPLSGGEYLFLSRFVHPAIGFLGGWVSMIAGFTAPIAAAALGAAVYAMPTTEVEPWQVKALAAGIIIVATGCQLLGAHVGGTAQNIIVFAKLALLVVIIAWAFLFAPNEVWQGRGLVDGPSSWWPESWSAWVVLAGSMSWIALSYTGFNAAIYVAGEARKPTRNVPRSMIVGTLTVTVVYLLLNYVFVYAPAPESIVGQERVAGIAGLAIGGVRLQNWIRVTIVLSMTSSVFAMLLTGPRVYQRMADDGVMPALFRSTGGVPRWAILVQAALSLVAVWIASLLELMMYLGLTLSACGALAVMSLWWAKRRLPDTRPLSWWENLAMVVYLSVTACIIAASYSTHFFGFIAMLATFVLGMVVYGIVRMMSNWQTKV
ncbi:APC family permease [Aureliella helgolandensis]|uniref:Serine/threonine exchanger SteT n=1 Tax=Aureliella helgolandensis TaxID=2527968 RepID=A0A518GHC1_9BACT|nr:APC family permease [Aureliella helgolandensis]QDV27992.1 Serine/threonine exchanger SteT [Aureliella helgolandensis]